MSEIVSYLFLGGRKEKYVFIYLNDNPSLCIYCILHVAYCCTINLFKLCTLLPLRACFSASWYGVLRPFVTCCCCCCCFLLHVLFSLFSSTYHTN